MPTQSDISSQIVSALGVTIPDLDTSIGTPTRKIIDAVSEVVAEAYVDQFFLGYNYDISSLTGSALDDFVNLFGMTRFGARRATGVATFAVPQAALQATSVPAGTAISTNDSPPIIFTTLITSVMPIGAVSIDAPIIAQVGGSNGNVSPNAIANFGTPMSGFTNVANTNATSGGSDAESDDALRNRFENTVFRNMAGTEQMFLGVAQENPATVLANVIGASKTHLEQVQITGGVGQSTIQAAQYIYPINYVFGPDIDNQEILNPGVNYTFNPNTYAMSAPSVLPTLSLITSGGTFANATHRYYRIAWGNDTGTTPAGSEATTVTTALNQGIQLTMPTAPLIAEWIYIYGSGTTNTEVLLAIIPVSQTTWTDNNSYTGTQAYPTTNTAGYSPTITSIDSVNCPDGIYDFQFQYSPLASRNSPATGITNKIDIYIQGDDEQQATDTVIWPASPTAFNSVAGDPMNFTHYIHPDLTRPTVGNYFLPLTFTPVTELPSAITVSALGGTPVAGSSSTVGSIIYSTETGTGTEVGALTYYYGVDYFLVNDSSNLGNSPHSNSGIEWRSVANGGNPVPPANSLLPVLYNYNAVPREVETAINLWRLVTTDVWCHAAKQMMLNTTFVVVLASGYTSASVLGAVETAVQGVMTGVGFDGILSASEILTAVGQISGILAVRFATQADATAGGSTNWAIQQVNSAAGIIQTFAYSNRVTDVYFPDDTVPVFNTANLYVRAFNTYMTGA
jgi:Baseplate J-like protein